LTGLGIVTSYFSDAFISAYTSSSAVHVLVSQLKDLLGLKHTIRYNGAFKIPKTLYDVASKMSTANIPTLITSIICIFYLVLSKEVLNPRVKRRIKFEFPSELLLVSKQEVLMY
jgi:MFS superfamily sulfate permease-like transporter